MRTPYSSAGAFWTDLPASRLGWLVLTLVILAYALGLDRTFLVDQQNYLENFARAPDLDWLDGLRKADSPLQIVIVWVFSEEALWQVWATVLGSIFSPSAAVILTVFVLNLLVALAVMRLSDPISPLLIWIVVPVGFAVTGLLQIRQGFAFGLMLYFALRLNRPILGLLIAAAIHATFALALPFALIAWLCGRRGLLAIVLAIALAVGTAYLGGILFEAFGGRRLKVYSVNDTEATSILYVFGALLCSLPSLYRLLTLPAPDEKPALSRCLASIALVHVGVVAFVATSFFVFPLGAGRVGYLIMLLLIPILPTMQRQGRLIETGVYSIMLIYLVYLATKTALEGTYDVYFAG